MAGGNHILSKKNFSSHSDFASQYELSPAPFPPNIPLKSTSSRHKFLHKMQEGGHWPTLDMKSEKAENRNSLGSARERALNSHILIIELSTLLTVERRVPLWKVPRGRGYKYRGCIYINCFKQITNRWKTFERASK